MTEQSNAEKRRAATTHAAAGGGMIAAGTAGSMAADRYLTRKGLKGPVKTLAEGGPRKIRGNAKRLKGSHLKFMGMKAASRPLTAVGIPMAAYGAYNLARPHKEQVKRVSVKDDVAKPIARAAVLADHRMSKALDPKMAAKLAKLKSGFSPREIRRTNAEITEPIARRKVTRRKAPGGEISKAAGLTPEERTKLIRRKRVGRDLSLVGGTLGLGALALRAPAGAKLASRSARLAKVPGVQRLAGKGEQATRLSNTTGIAAIGTGSVGSFNYASQQRLESKSEKAKIRKGKLPTWKWINGERVRITGIHQPSGRLMGTNSRDETVFASPARKGPRKAPPAAPPNAAYLKAKDDLTKADPFLRQYGQNISTGAEDGYRYLKGVRNDSAKRSATGAAATVGSAALLAKLGRKATRNGVTRGAAVGLLAAGAGSAAYSAGKARKAKRMQGHMNKIKAKGIERAAAGELGRDRVPVSKAALLREDYARALSVDSDLSKALGGLRLGRAAASTVPRIGQGTISTKPRVAGLRRLGSGRLISVKGSTR